MINPTGMTVTDWTDSMVYSLEKYGSTSRLDDPDKWDDWALGILSFPYISNQNPPPPTGYSNWLDWAYAFTRAVNLGG
jgi:hypothetical protein